MKTGDRVRYLTADKEPVGHYDQKYLRFNGAPFDVEVTAVPYLYEGQNRTLVMSRDITERMKREGGNFSQKSKNLLKREKGETSCGELKPPSFFLESFIGLRSAPGRG